MKSVYMQKKLKKSVAFVMAAVLVFSCNSNELQAKKTFRIKKLFLNVKQKKMFIGSTFQLKVKQVKPVQAAKKVKWTSTNKAVATVNKKGLVKAKKIGTAQVTATSKGNKKVKAKCKIVVAVKPDNHGPDAANNGQVSGTSVPTIAQTGEGDKIPVPAATPTEAPTKQPTQYEENNTPAVFVEKVTALQGQNAVEVEVRVRNNPGILGMTLSISFDESALTLVDAINGEAFRDVLALTKSKVLKSGCRFVWDGQELTENDIKDGTVLLLVFNVSETAQSGEYQISVNCNDGDIIDNELMPIALSFENGAIKLSDSRGG